MLFKFTIKSSMDSLSLFTLFIYCIYFTYLCSRRSRVCYADSALLASSSPRFDCALFLPVCILWSGPWRHYGQGSVLSTDRGQFLVFYLSKLSYNSTARHRETRQSTQKTYWLGSVQSPSGSYRISPGSKCWLGMDECMLGVPEFQNPCWWLPEMISYTRHNTDE